MGRDEIATLVHRYADAVVHRDGEQWAATWAPEAVWELGQGRRVEGREAIFELWQKAMGGMTAVVQTVLNGEVTLDEEAGTGSGRWYIQESMQRSTGVHAILLAHYDDTYVRTDEGWRFASRELTPHYQGPPDLSATFLNAVDG
ncbi:MAG: nuclear transport factor 2 family protein [Actinomycetota bacterium]|nr:nuclear transport factor 2 family protein [Actinomycetota bacterium]